jgi:YVTN family beta-propeller protein
MSKNHLAFAVAALAALAFPASARTLVVLNKAEATASLIDLATGEVRATLPTGVGPHEVAISPDGKRALVADYGAQSPGASLTLIDLTVPKVEKTIALGEYRRPHGIQFLADGKRALVTAEENRALILVDVETGAVLRSMPTNANLSHMVAAAPDGARAFVANIGSGSISAIDVATGTLVKVVPTGAGAEGIDVTPDGKSVWVTNRAADTVSVVDTATLEVVATLPSAAFPIRAKATPDGKHVLVSNARSGDVTVFDALARKEICRIPMKAAATDTNGKLFSDQFGASPVPIGILIEPGGLRAYVAMASADAIAIIDLEKWEVVGALKAGREPDGLGFSKLVIAAAAKPE